MDSFVLLVYANIAVSCTLLQWLLACLNFTLDYSEDLFCWYKWKKVISMNYGSCISNWKPQRLVKLYMILRMRDRYINSSLNPLRKFSRSSRSTDFKDILPWKIPQMITKTIPISTRVLIKHAMKQASHCEFHGTSMETETTTWSEFLKGGKAIAEQIPASEKINKSKTAGLWESKSQIWVGKLTIWVRLLKITNFTRSTISTRIGEPVLIMDVKVSKDKHFSRCWSRECHLC